MIATVKNWYERIAGALFMLSVSAGTALAQTGGGVGDWIDKDDNWTTYVKNALTVTQVACIALGIFAGLKIFTLWLSGSEEGGRDKGAIVKWCIGMFIIIAFFAFITYFEKSILEGK